MADRSLDVRMRVRNARQFNADMKKGERGIKSLTTATGRANLRARAGARAMGGLSTALRAVGRAGLYAGGALAAGGVVFGKRSIDEWRDAQKVLRETEQRIVSTGGVANVTAKEVAGLSGAISGAVGIDDEDIQRAGNLLLTFRNIRNEQGKGNDIFTRGLRTATDMAAAYDMDTRSATIMLGKALQEPAKMATALKRTGAIDDEGVQRLQKMEESGASIVEQQKALLRLINKAGVRKAALAEADAVERLTVSWSNVEEAAGGVIGPPAMAAANKFATFLNRQVIPELEGTAEKVSAIWDPKSDRSFSQNLRQTRTVIGRELGPVWGDLKDDLERANIDDKLLDAFSDAVPRIAETMGEGGGRAAVAFVKGMSRAPLWAQLFTGALIAAKLSRAVGAFSSLGTLAAGKFGPMFARKAGESLVAQQAVDQLMGSSIAGRKAKWGRLGKIAGRTFGVGFAILAADEIGDFFKGIPAIDQYSGKKGWGELGRDIADWLPGEDSEDRRKRTGRVGVGVKGLLPNRGAGAHPDNFRGMGRRPERLKPFRGGPIGVGSSNGDTVVHTHINLDGKPIAEVVGRHVGDRRARR